jgi:hypothetical protein
VTSGVILQIGLGFHDPAGGDAAAELAHQDFAEQSPGECYSVVRHAGTRNSLDGFLNLERSSADDDSLPGRSVIKQDS